MNSTSATAIILSSLTQYGSAILFILSSIIGIGLGMLVFRFGWNKLSTMMDTAPRGQNAYMTSYRYGITSNGKRYDTWSS